VLIDAYAGIFISDNKKPAYAGMDMDGIGNGFGEIKSV
jgi:hypothetical protein